MSEQLLSWAPRFDLELNRVRGVDDVDDSPFVALAVDESIVLTVRTGVAREVECLDVLDIAEAVTSRLAGVAKRFAQLEYVAFVFEVAEMVCRAEEEHSPPLIQITAIVECERGAPRIDLDAEVDLVDLERFDEALDITSRRVRGGDLLEFGADRVDRGDVHLDVPVSYVEANPRSRVHLSQPTRSFGGTCHAA